MAKLPTYVALDLSTASESKDKAVVDIKLLKALFKHFKPADIDTIKDEVKSLVDNCKSLAEISDAVGEYTYVAGIATVFHNTEVEPSADRMTV